MGSFKVIAKTGIEIVAELGPYHDFDEARGDAQELADKMVDAAQVYVLDEMAQAELGVGGPVPFSQAPELQLEETALALVPEANPQESLGSRWGRNPTENPAYLAYHAAPGEIKRQLKEAARLVDQGDLRGADSLIRSSGASRADLWWILGNERLAQLHEWADPVVARHPHPEKAAWPSERARWRHPPGKYERNPHGGGSLDEAIATAEYVVKDATEAGQLAFGMGDTEGAGKYVRQVEKAKRDLSKLQAARHSVGHRSYLGSTEGRGRYGAERRWRQRMGREAAEVIAAQRAGGRYVNPSGPLLWSRNDWTIEWYDPQKKWRGFLVEGPNHSDHPSVYSLGKRGAETYAEVGFDRPESIPKYVQAAVSRMAHRYADDLDLKRPNAQNRNPERYLSADQERLLDEVVLTAENYGHHYPSDPAKAVDEAIRTIKDYREVGLDEDMTEIRSFAIRRVQAEWRRHNAHGAD